MAQPAVGVPLVRDTLYNNVRVSLLNLFGNTNISVPKVAVTTDDLLAICAKLDTRFFEHARDWCACLIAFWGLLRVREHMASGLRFRHIQLAINPADDEVTGLHITINSSKTSNAPVTISVSARPDLLCPVGAYIDYFLFLRRLRIPTEPDSPLFVFRSEDGSHRAMTDSQFIAQVRSYYRAAFPDRDPRTYAGHSFRRGGTSALILAGVSVPLIKAHGRWSSEAFNRYFDSVHSPEMRLAATQALVGSVKRPRLT